MMFMLGFVLLGTTLLIPLFTQTMLGYPAEQAGLALMPGGLLIIAACLWSDSCSPEAIRDG